MKKKFLRLLISIPVIFMPLTQISCNESKPDPKKEYEILGGIHNISTVFGKNFTTYSPWILSLNGRNVNNSEVEWSIVPEEGTTSDITNYISFNESNSLSILKGLSSGEYIFDVNAKHKDSLIKSTSVMLSINSSFECYIQKNDDEPYLDKDESISYQVYNNSEERYTKNVHWQFKINGEEIDYSSKQYVIWFTHSGDTDPSPYFTFDKDPTSPTYRQITWKSTTPVGFYSFKLRIRNNSTYDSYETESSINIQVSKLQSKIFDFNSLNFEEYEQTGLPGYYNDSFFLSSSKQYNPSLSSLSSAVTMSSGSKNFNITDKSQKTMPRTYDFSQGYTYQKQMLVDKLGFENFDYNDWYTKKPTSESIAVCAATKKFEFMGESFTLIALPIRSAFYLAEWVSNFTIGTGSNTYGHHEGFYNAANTALSFLKSYIQNKHITGKIKLWVTGFSRGGAVSNTIGGLLDTAIKYGASGFGKTISDYLTSSVTLSTDDMYIYTFEAPQTANCVTSSSAKNPKEDTYNNIFNIVSPNDIVPMVPPSQWGFQRYGIDLYNSIGYFDDTNYSNTLSIFKSLYNMYKDEEPILNNYDKINDIKYYYAKKYIPNEFKQMSLFHLAVETIELLANKIGSRSKFCSKYQEPIREAFLKVFSEENVSMSKVFSSLVWQIKGLIFDAITDSRIATLVSTIYKDTEPLLLGHMPIVCYTWCHSCDPFYCQDTKINSLKTNLDYYHITSRAINLINCYTDGSHTNLITKVNGKSTNSTVDTYSNYTSSGVYTITIGYPDYATMYLPADKHYYFMYSATARLSYSKDQTWLKIEKTYFSEPTTILLQERNIEISGSTPWYYDLDI